MIEVSKLNGQPHNAVLIKRKNVEDPDMRELFIQNSKAIDGLASECAQVHHAVDSSTKDREIHYFIDAKDAAKFAAQCARIKGLEQEGAEILRGTGKSA